jgi:hypothetical protein
MGRVAGPGSFGGLTFIVNASWKSLDRNQLLWPVAGVVLGAIAGTNPFYRPHIPLDVGVAAWFMDMAFVMILSLHPVTVRVAILVAGLFMAVPCFVLESPMSRFLLMCCTAFPFALASMQSFAAPAADFRERLAWAFTWLGTREIKRRPRSFAAASLLRLIVATVVLCAAIAAVKAVSPSGLWWLVRWQAGGIMILAFAEMATASHYFLTALAGLSAPALMQSPHLSTSIGEFWAKRWNPATSMGFRMYIFAPLARRGIGLALCAAFLGSAVAHVMLLYMATGRWGISLMWGFFFLIQSLFIAAERRMKARHWRSAAGRAWTLSALAIISPLFVEPALQLIEPSWGTPDDVLQPTLVALGFVILVNAFVSLGSLAAKPESDIAEPCAAPNGGPATRPVNSSKLGITGPASVSRSDGRHSRTENL